MTPNVAGWVAPYIPTVLPCCEMPQVRNFVEESILQGLQTIITPLISTSSANTTQIAIDIAAIYDAISENNSYQQNIDISKNFTLPLTSTALPSNICLQVVIISPVNGFWLTINSGGEIFIPPYTTLPINASNTNILSARYQTAGDVLSYYYH
jgi:hypothetical protein